VFGNYLSYWADSFPAGLKLGPAISLGHSSMLWQFGISLRKTWGIAEIQIVNNSKSANSMDLEQRHIVKFLRIKGLEHGEITKELSSACGLDTYTLPRIKDWSRQIKLGKTDLQT
jgi:hypothetical protein